MSIYFLGSRQAQPLVAFDDPSGESEACDFENWLLAAGHSIPLFWLAIFSESDLKDYPVQPEDGQQAEIVQVPCARKEQAAQRLRSRAGMLNRWFSAGNQLNYHIELFAGWLETLPYSFITVDWAELMTEEGLETSYFRRLLRALDEDDDSALEDFWHLTSLHPGVRFITLEVAASGNFTQEEMHNFFFLLGDGDHHTPPWS